jgi:hypothetical protein
LITRLAEAGGVTVETRIISAGGASLRRRWNKGEAQAAIRGGGYDYVVLQEQSTLPLKNAARMQENVRLFDQIIREAGARTVLYLTWARGQTPGQQSAITEVYTSISGELKAIVVPAGVAWQRFLKSHDRPVLHDRDNSHPTIAGTYLTACVFVATLLKLSPEECQVPVDGLSPADAAILQRAASTKDVGKPRQGRTKSGNTTRRRG